MTVGSPTDIGNLALDLLTAGTVNDINNPQNATESLLHRWYNVTRLKVLREHPWNFASKRIALSPTGTVPAFGYTQEFQLPVDFVRLNCIVNSNSQIVHSANYEIENGKILYNSENAVLRLKYVYNMTNVTQMDALFVDLLAVELALAIAYKVTSSNSDVERLEALRKNKAMMARAVDGQERPPQVIQNSRLLAARRSHGMPNYFTLDFT